jgi:hypothetical protein
MPGIKADNLIRRGRGNERETILGTGIKRRSNGSLLPLTHEYNSIHYIRSFSIIRLLGERNPEPPTGGEA